MNQPDNHHKQHEKWDGVHQHEVKDGTIDELVIPVLTNRGVKASTGIKSVTLNLGKLMSTLILVQATIVSAFFYIFKQVL